MNAREYAVSYLVDKFGSNVRAIYGIGSAFIDDVDKVSDADVIAILYTLSEAPTQWNGKIYENVYTDDVKFTFLYGTLEDYLDEKRFKAISFSDWSWSVRSLKFGSQFLYGEDIRDYLPVPKYNYRSILLRSAYHLDGGSRQYSEEIQLTKAIFKFGFYLIAVYYPEENIFGKKAIYEKLKQAVRDGYISNEMLRYYKDAFEIRNGKKIENFYLYKQEFIKYWIEEVIRSTNTSWEKIKEILLKGFEDGRGFNKLVISIESLESEIEWEIGSA